VCTAAGTSGRVVFVGDMQVRRAEWSEQPLHIMHAAVAFMARLGLISGASIVVIDERGYAEKNRLCEKITAKERGPQ
jgi:hypothetical protein